MLLIDAIRLKAENTTNQMSKSCHSVCQSCINIIIIIILKTYFCQQVAENANNANIRPEDAGAGAGAGVGAGVRLAGTGVGVVAWLWLDLLQSD